MDMIIKPEFIHKPTRREFLKYSAVTALAFGVPALLPKRAYAAWDKGFDFRASSGAETDPTDCTYALTTDSYLTTRNSVDFGYSSIGGGVGDSRDRDIGNDARLEGMWFISNSYGVGMGIRFTVDLPAAGVYDIWAAFGDPSNTATIYAVLKDNATAFVTIAGTVTGAGNSFVDASGATRTAAQWLADSARGGTKVTRTFASTKLIIDLGDTTAAGSGSSSIAHLFISQVGGGVSYFNRRRGQ